MKDYKYFCTIHCIFFLHFACNKVELYGLLTQIIKIEKNPSMQNMAGDKNCAVKLEQLKKKNLQVIFSNNTQILCTMELYLM